MHPRKPLLEADLDVWEFCVIRWMFFFCFTKPDKHFGCSPSCCTEQSHGCPATIQINACAGFASTEAGFVLQSGDHASILFFFLLFPHCEHILVEGTAAM